MYNILSNNDLSTKTTEFPIGITVPSSVPYSDFKIYIANNINQSYVNIFNAYGLQEILAAVFGLHQGRSYFYGRFYIVAEYTWMGFFFDSEKWQMYSWIRTSNEEQLIPIIN